MSETLDELTPNYHDALVEVKPPAEELSVPSVRVQIEKVASNLNVQADDSNIVALPDLLIGLEAIGDNIIVLLDNYKSGYECTTCGGTGFLIKRERCICDPDVEDSELGAPRGTRNRFGAVCELCGGEYKGKRRETKLSCGACHGQGSKLFIPEVAQSQPTTGIILSVGPEVNRKGIEKNIRVVATPYSGTFLPMLNGAQIKVYRQHEPLIRLYNMVNGEMLSDKPGELTTSKFVELDTPLGPGANA